MRHVHPDRYSSIALELMFAMHVPNIWIKITDWMFGKQLGAPIFKWSHLVNSQNPGRRCSPYRSPRLTKGSKMRLKLRPSVKPL